jgi:hypothetical protein
MKNEGSPVYLRGTADGLQLPPARYFRLQGQVLQRVSLDLAGCYVRLMLTHNYSITASMP